MQRRATASDKCEAPFMGTNRFCAECNNNNNNNKRSNRKNNSNKK